MTCAIPLPLGRWCTGIARAKDPTREMIKLTTYLGHANPAHTYWYHRGGPGTARTGVPARGDRLWREEARP